MDEAMRNTIIILKCNNDDHVCRNLGDSERSNTVNNAQFACKNYINWAQIKRKYIELKKET